jgi:hypothetical protein
MDSYIFPWIPVYSYGFLWIPASAPGQAHAAMPTFGTAGAMKTAELWDPPPLSNS